MSKDTSFFFQRDQHRLFGICFNPETFGESPRGVVLCNAFGKEYPICRTSLSRFARSVAAAGFPAIRFDYMGYGDSSGDFADATVQSMQEDIGAAVEELRRRTGVERIALLGIRFGAALAALAAGRYPCVDRLILWEPQPEPWKVLWQALRHTIAMQTMMFKLVHFTREQILENVLSGRPSIADGYEFNVIDEGFPLSAAFVREAREINLLRQLPPSQVLTLIVHVQKSVQPVSPRIQGLVDALRANGTDCTLELAREPVFPWKHENLQVTVFPDVFSKTLSWMKR